MDLPGFREAKPTNIPAIRANELRLDNLFELEDETVAIVGYESDYSKAGKVQREEMLTDEELMELIILPLSYREREK